MYDSNMQIKKEGDFPIFHKLDPLLLWLVNTTSCYCQLKLACFANNFAFV